MKPIRYIVFTILLMSIIVLVLSTFYMLYQADYTLPQIDVEEGTLTVTVEEQKNGALMQGITAWDDKDGDITDNIIIQNIEYQAEKTMEVTYSVVDSDNHVATIKRTVIYEDYEPPRFYLEAPLRYGVGNVIQVKNRLGATDMIDGDISESIKVNANSLSPYYEGEYPVIFEVTNSLGDTSSIILNITIAATAKKDPDIRLKEYLVYSTLDEEFDPSRYLLSVVKGDKDNVTAKLPSGGLVKGVNQVIYTYTGSDAELTDTVLFVVVE